jgi:ABC-2 type transport system permease protein
LAISVLRSRALRDSRYIVLALVAPVGFYLLFSTLFGGPDAGPNAVTVQVGLMVSMSVFGAM